MLSLKPRLLKKRKRGGQRTEKTPPSSAPDSTLRNRRRYYLRSMASGQHTDDYSGVEPNTVPTQYSAPQHTPHPSRTKRTWSDEEDALVIEVLFDLHATGKYKADRGFKPGYLAAEKELERRRPGGGIRANPHIYSRVKTLKSHFNIVSDMIYNNASEFGWDPVRMCVIADDAVWSAYLQVISRLKLHPIFQTHKMAAQFRDKTFKYLK